MLQTKLRSIKHRWLRAIGIATIITILLSCLGVPVSQTSAQVQHPVWRVDAQGNITKDGAVFRIKGGSWFGLEGRHEPSNDPDNPSGAPMEQYMGNVFWAPSSRTYTQDVNEFKAMGINLVRIPLVPQTLTGTDPQGMEPYLKNHDSVVIPNSRLALETIIRELNTAGIYVLLDIHSCSNYVGWRKGRLDARPPWSDFDRDNYDFKRENYSCAATNNPPSVTTTHPYDMTKWRADLRTLAGLGAQLGVTNIMGIDIYNEPHDYTWPEWRSMIDIAYEEINAVNPNILIFAQGVGSVAGTQDGSPTTTIQVPHGDIATTPNWGENLFEAGANPPTMPKNRLVYSPHTYGPSVFVQKMFMDPTQPECAELEGDAAGDHPANCRIVINPTLLQQGWHEHFGYLKALGYAVVIGEFGGNMDWPRGKASLRDQNRWNHITDTTIDAQWQTAFVDYLLSVGITDTIYWSINPESGDTGGIYTTPFQPGSNESGWGTWGPLDSRKIALLNRLWNAAQQPTLTPTITPTGPTHTPTRTPTRTNTPIGPTNTPTPTVTATRTPTNTGTPGALKVQLMAGGTDNTQQSSFRFRVQNTGSSALTNISARVYFTLDGSQAASNYVLEKYHDQSGVATISGPTQASGSTYYFTINYGTASLPAGGSWEFHTTIHLSNWSNNHSSGNDWWRSTGTLPASYTDWANIPGYVSGTRVWGSEPVTGVTNTPTRTNTPVTPTSTPTRTNTPVGPTNTPTRTNTPVGPTNTPTRTNTPVTPTATPTRTNTPVGPTNTPTRTNTPVNPTNTPTPTTVSGACVVTYSANDWGSGFTANITIQNNSASAINGWTLTWTFSGNQQITNLWQGVYTQTGQSVSVTNPPDYNITIAANGGTQAFGFNANYSGANARPNNFALNGTACSVSP